jgi:hypothetical protein
MRVSTALIVGAAAVSSGAGVYMARPSSRPTWNVENLFRLAADAGPTADPVHEAKLQRLQVRSVPVLHRSCTGCPEWHE